MVIVTILGKVSLEKKLFATTAGTLLLLAGLSVFSMQTISQLGSRLDEGINVSARRLDLFNAIRARLQELASNSRAATLASAVKDSALAAQ